MQLAAHDWGHRHCSVPYGVSAHDLAVTTLTKLGGPGALARLVLDCVRIGAWERLLFVQCHDGWIAEEAWRRVPRAYACGLDVSPAHVARARQLREVPGKLEFRTWDGQRLPCPERGFDRVLATFALARARDPAALLCEVRRVLRPEGEAYLLEAVSSGAALRRTLAQAGFTAPRELARFDGEGLVLVHAGASIARALAPILVDG